MELRIFNRYVDKNNRKWLAVPPADIVRVGIELMLDEGCYVHYSGYQVFLDEGFTNMFSFAWEYEFGKRPIIQDNFRWMHTNFIGSDHYPYDHTLLN